MSLDDEYLRYPKRAYGMDQDRYAWRPTQAPSVSTWPDAKRLAVMIVAPIEHHTLTPKGVPFRHPGAMVTPYPDLRHYTTRDYGARVGVYRLLEALAAEKIKATFAINALRLAPLAYLIEAVKADGHEIAAYGLSTDHIHWGGLERSVEAAWISEVRQRFSDVGLKPRAWLSPARQQSFATLDLIAEAGFDICLDWEPDDVLVRMKTAAGPVYAAPLLNELDDRTLLIDRRQSEEEWADQILEAASYLTKSDGFGGRVLGFTLTPYVAGQPFRIRALKRMLAGLKANPQTWIASVSSIIEAAVSRSA